MVKQLEPAAPEHTPLAAILGDDTAAGNPDEIAWAFRKLLESRAAELPLVVVFDDVHWGEPAFLDLVEHVADLSRGAPILLLCMARPELLDRRPSWGGGKLNATNVLLEPLASGEAAELIDELTSEIPADLRERILDAAEGNPLFVEEMVAMVSEDGDEVVVPPTIQALLAARLDQLEPAERGVLERGAVEGLVFHRGAVAALAPEEPQVDGRLVTLVRKDLVRPEQTVLADDEAYRFRHSADPGHGVRRAAEGRPRRPARALRRPGSKSAARVSSSWTRSSATTSSRRTVTASSWGRSTPQPLRSGDGRRSGCCGAVSAPTRAATQALHGPYWPAEWS